MTNIDLVLSDTKVIYLNFPPLVSRYRDPQPQKVGKY